MAGQGGLLVGWARVVVGWGWPGRPAGWAGQGGLFTWVGGGTKRILAGISGIMMKLSWARGTQVSHKCQGLAVKVQFLMMYEMK